MSNPKLNILIPVYNEEKRLQNGVRVTCEYLSTDIGIPYVLTIVDNASNDRTEEIARALCDELPKQVRYIRIAEKGVGAAIRAGVAENQSDIVGYMDVDLSTDIHAIQIYRIYAVLSGSGSLFCYGNCNRETAPDQKN